MAVNETYKPLQDLRNTDINKWHATIDREQAKNAVNPDRHIAHTNEEMNQRYEAADIDPAGQYHNPTRGWSSDDPNYQSTVDRTVKEGTSGADEYWLNDSELAYIQHCKGMYAEAKTQAERDYWHAEAEKTRARQGYSGGADGSMYIATMQKSNSSAQQNSRIDMGDGVGAGTGGVSGGTSNPTSDLKGLLDAWQQAAMQQSNGQVDYAVAKAVADLERALADAQPQFKEQAESVDRDARQAMDNSALYAEIRGDKGGIGQEQYNAIQNTQAQNHLAVQQMQIKLATDTARQIADLRARGEFEKADTALSITQSYLTQLIDLEKWAAEYNLSVEQFDASLKQWAAEYDLALEKLWISKDQWQQKFVAEQKLSAQSQLAGIGKALLSAGIPLTEEQMAAMGITAEQVSQSLWQQQLQSAAKDKETGVDESDDNKSKMDYDALFRAARASGYPKSYIANNYKKYGFSSSSGLHDDYKGWIELMEDGEEGVNEGSILALGAGVLSQEQVMDMVLEGILEIEKKDDVRFVRWADGWNAAKYYNR